MIEDDRSEGLRLVRRLREGLVRNDGSTPRFDVDHETAIDPTPDGTLAATLAADGRSLAAVYAQPTRAYVEFEAAPTVAAASADAAGLRVRPKASRPPKTLVFVESVGDVEPALGVIAAVHAASESPRGADESP
ncbi:hypothetical protein SAMN05216559_2170 [Halomicrobium zhouii]|uniref:DUF7993 domain-containing protein n=1 Tax=Halomicrobium zhouii TaxID=767519 RepID=A0A1I6L703_9EURY|nr:hypothetical protein [Halomicrobium zhouii]SFR99207.1 hypothetical protein SAMN05216559_2170 [Halomicrobium zhouii]